MGLPAAATKALALRRANPFQQFGQANDVSTRGGATGCTHTVLQFLALLWLRKWFTHDQISKMVGYTATNGRGLRPPEVQRFCDLTGLPYRVVLGLDYRTVMAKTAMGPVGFGHKYAWVPEWKGAFYQGILADGKPNGFAGPSGQAGKTQLSGFTGAHFGLVLGAGQGATSFQVYSWEPNHGSPARPERPPYDIYTEAQFAHLYDSYSTNPPTGLGRTPYALVPTRSLP